MPLPAALAGLFLLPVVLTGPPATEINPVTDTLHGEAIIDNYRWLESLEGESEAVREWTTAQNEYTRGVLDDLPGRVELEARLSELMTIGSISAPTMRENLYFYRERKGTENQAVLYVRESHDGDPRELLNPNTLDAEGLYSLDWYSPSRDGTLLAFGLSYAGDEMTVLHVMDVASGRWLADEIPGKVGVSGWMPDNSGFLYSRLDEPSNAYSRTIRFHKLGDHHRHDPLLLAQDEPSRIPFGVLSDDGRWIIAGISDGWSRNDLYVTQTSKWLEEHDTSLTTIAEGIDARFVPQTIHGDTLFMMTTHDAPHGRLYSIDLTNPAEEAWKLIIPERDDAVLQGVSHADGILVAAYEKDASSRLTRFDLKGNPLGEVSLPGLGSARIATRYDRTEAFLTFTSFNEPPSIYRVDLAGDDGSLWARPEVPIDPSLVTVKQVWYPSKDGTRIPMFIVHRRGLELDGDNPCVLYGYGGFNISLTPYFSATQFPWYEGGGVYAIANLRGGSEYGEEWHRAGMRGNKQNVFDDFYAAAEYLIGSGYTSSDRLAVRGGSNGGLLTGVAVTQRPELFAAAISAVPLLDMLRYHDFLMAKFWVPEYGSSEDSEQYEWLRAYSPYHNIREGVQYPAVLFTAGENDNRVHPLHARKMAAAMQTLAGNELDEDPILLWVDRSGGHGQGKPLSLRIRDTADTWSFLMWQTGMLDDYRGSR